MLCYDLNMTSMCYRLVTFRSYLQELMLFPSQHFMFHDSILLVKKTTYSGQQCNYPLSTDCCGSGWHLPSTTMPCFKRRTWKTRWTNCQHLSVSGRTWLTASFQTSCQHPGLCSSSTMLVWQEQPRWMAWADRLRETGRIVIQMLAEILKPDCCETAGGHRLIWRLLHVSTRRLPSLNR